MSLSTCEYASDPDAVGLEDMTVRTREDHALVPVRAPAAAAASPGGVTAGAGVLGGCAGVESDVGAASATSSCMELSPLPPWGSAASSVPSCAGSALSATCRRLIVRRLRVIVQRRVGAAGVRKPATARRQSVCEGAHRCRCSLGRRCCAGIVGLDNGHLRCVHRAQMRGPEHARCYHAALARGISRQSLQVLRIDACMCLLRLYRHVCSGLHRPY